MTEQLAAYRTQASTAGLSAKQLITNLIKSKAEELGLAAATKILQATLVGLNIALALGASYLISKGISAWQEYSQRIETAATKSKEAADAAKQTTSSLKELVATYEELGDKSEWDSDSYNQAKDIQEQILDVLKDQNSAIEDKLGKIDLANGKYQEQLGILKDITAEQLRNEHSDLKQDVVAQGDLLVKTAKKNTSQMAYVSGGANSSDGVMASKIANAIGGTYNSASGSFSLGSMDLNDPKSIAEWYDKINQALKIFSENSTEAQMSSSGLYQWLVRQKNGIQDQVEAYNDSTDAMEDNELQQRKLETVRALANTNTRALNGALAILQNTIDGFDASTLVNLLNGIGTELLTPDQQAALDKIREFMTAKGFTTEQIQAFVDVLVEIGRVSPSAADGIDEAAAAAKQAAEDFEEANKRIDNLQSAYQTMSACVDEYNKNGWVTVDNLQALSQLEPQYLACLEKRDGQMSINTESVQKLAEAEIDLYRVSLLNNTIQGILATTSVEKANQILGQAQSDMSQSKQMLRDAKKQALQEAYEKYGSGDEFYAVRKAINQQIDSWENLDDLWLDLKGKDPSTYLGKTSSASKSTSKSVSDAASAFDTLISAMKEYNQYGYVSANTAKSLAGLEDKYTACLTKQNGKLVLNTEKFKDYIKQQIIAANAADDDGKSAYELMKILSYLNESVDSETISFEQLTDAIKGYGTAMDEAKEKTDAIKSAFSDLDEVGKSKINNPFGLLDADSVEKQYQAIRDLADGSELFTNADYAGALNPETGEIDYNSDAFKKIFLDRLDSMIAACKETGGAAGEYLAKGFEDARDKIAGNVISIEEYINGIGSTLSNINDRMDNFQSAFNDLADITKEYNIYGNLSQDSIQKFMALDPKYTACLEMQGDNLVFNKDAFRALYVAELQELALKYEGTDAGKVYADILQKVADGTWDVTDHMQGMGTEMENLKSALNELKDLFSSLFDLFEKFGSNKDNDLKIWGEAMTEHIDDQIEALNKQKEALEKANDEEERAITLAKLQAELEKARTQRTVRKYTSNGYEWVSDSSAAKEAQDNLNDQQRTWRKEDAEKAIDDQIDKLNELKDKYSEIINLIGTSWDDYNKKLKYSAEIADMTFTEMEGRLDVFKGNVLGAMQSTKATSGIQDVISKLESLITALEKINNLYSWAESGFTDYTDKGFNGLIKTAKKIFGSTGSDGKLNISISTGLKNIGQTVKDAFSGTSGNSITKAFQTGWEAISSGAKGLFSGSGANSLTTIFSNGLSGISDFIGSAFKGLGSTFASGGRTLVKAAGSVATKIGSALGIGGGVAAGGATAAGGGVAIAGASAIPVIGAIVAGVVNGINTNIRLIKDQKKIWSSDDKIGTKIVKSVGNTVWRYSPIGMIASTIQNISGFVKKIFGIESKKDKNNGTSSNGKIDVGSIVINSPDSPASNANSGTSGSDTGTTKQSFWDRIKNSKLWFWNWGKRAVGDKGVKHSGMYNVDEQGPELLVRQPASGRYTYLETSDGVVPADITSKLFEMGGNTDKWFADQLSKNGALNNIQNKTIGDTISVGDIYIQNPVGDTDALAREIVRDLPIKLRQQQGRR